MSHLREWRPGVRQTSFKTAHLCPLLLVGQSVDAFIQGDLECITRTIPQGVHQGQVPCTKGTLDSPFVGSGTFGDQPKTQISRLHNMTNGFDCTSNYRLMRHYHKWQVKQCYLMGMHLPAISSSNKEGIRKGWSRRSHINLLLYSLRLGSKAWDKQSC